jgi:hypothetical protein
MPGAPFSLRSRTSKRMKRSNLAVALVASRREKSVANLPSLVRIPLEVPVREFGNMTCRKCGSSRVMSVPVVYRRGLSRTEGETRFSGTAFGAASGDLFSGKARVRSSRQTELSRCLAPPVRLSYSRTVGRSFLLLLVVAWLLFYARSVTGLTHGLLSLLLSSIPSLTGVVMLFMTFLVWWHNQVVFPRQYERWNRGVLCERCGTVSR